MTTFSNLSIRRAVRVVGGLAALACALIASASIASAATITVTTSLDEYGAGTDCSLREAIQAANTDNPFGGCVSGSGNDVIVFTPTVTLVQLAIVGTGMNDDNSFLDLDILDTLTIDGGPNGVTIEPGISPWDDRIFDIPLVAGGQPATVILRNLTIQNGGSLTLSNETGNAPCLNGGGGVRNWSDGPLTLASVTIQNNTMPQNGGGVCQSGLGALTVLASTIYSNVATNGSGGGIFYDGKAFLFMVNSQVLSNTASLSGGGIHDDSYLFRSYAVGRVFLSVPS
jgi:CSLREA domain-containing protein